MLISFFVVVHNCAGALEIKDQLEPVSIVNSVFHHISTAKVDSRAIAIANSKNIEFKNCQIYACQGTAFWIMHTVITIEDCSIYDNKLGVMVFEKGNLTFKNNKITKNLNGMVIRPLYTLTSFENNEFSDNQEIGKYYDLKIITLVRSRSDRIFLQPQSDRYYNSFGIIEA